MIPPAKASKKTALRVFVGIVLAGMTIASPYIWAAGTFYKLKYSARQALAKYDAESLRNLDVVPREVALQGSDANPESLETIELGGYVIRVGRSPKRTDSGKAVVLTYPRFDARIRLPFSLAENDKLARQLNFKDTYDQSAAMYHTRPADLDTAQNVQELKRALLLISDKPPREPCHEEFTIGSLHGFIHDADPRTKMSVVDVYDSMHHIGVPIWITDRGGLTPGDIHAFLSTIQITATASQRTSSENSN